MLIYKQLLDMDIYYDIKKVIESLNFLIYDVYEGIDANDEQQLQYCFLQFNLFMEKNEYFENIKKYNKERNDKLLEQAIDNLTVIYDTQQEFEGEMNMEDKDKFNAWTNMGMILAKAYLFSYLRMNEGCWPKDSRCYDI